MPSYLIYFAKYKKTISCDVQDFQYINYYR